MKRLIAAILLTLTLCGCTYNKSITNEYSDTKLLMDTICTIRAGGENAKTAVDSAYDRVAEIAALTDYYLDTSDVSKINYAGANETVFISPDTSAILKTALEICKSSNGAFDITIAPVKDLWGFGDGNHEPPSVSDISAALDYVDYKNIVLDTQQNSVTKKSSNTKIDLGGCAKGYAADCAAEILEKSGVEYALIDFGGNILTFGKNPSRSDEKWLIGIQKPFSKNGECEQTIPLTDGAVVTSGTYQRYFEHNGDIYHHILDPTNGFPTDNGVSSASIVHNSALVADCLSTACMVLGEENGKTLADKYGARLIIIN